MYAPTLDEIEKREREIAQRHGIAWKRVDRAWVRGEALKELRAERAARNNNESLSTAKEAS